MNEQNPHKVERYKLGGMVFEKRYYGDIVRFYRDTEELTISQWNEAINKFFSMDQKGHHPNPLVRWKEKHRRERFLRLIQVPAGGHVVDVGSESGYISEFLMKNARRLTCVDIDIRLLKLAESRLGHDQFQYVVGDVSALPFIEAFTDVAVAAEIIEHLPEPRRGIAELLRIIKPGGRLSVSVPNEPLVLFIKRWLRRLGLGRFLGRLSPNLAIGHLHVFTKRLLQEQCTGIAHVEQLFYHKPFCLNIFAVLRHPQSNNNQ